MNMDHTAILTKVKKLLAVSEDSRANPNEAATAARQAQALLKKYNIDMADVIAVDLNTNKEAIGFNDVPLDYRKGKVYRQMPAWVSFLATAVAKAYDCEAAALGPGTIRFFGYSADVQIASWVYSYLTRAIYRAVPKDSGVAGSRAFCLGATRMVCARLRQEEAPSTGTALVVLKKSKIEETFGAFVYQAREVADPMDSLKYAEGIRFGSTININPGRPVENDDGHTPITHER